MYLTKILREVNEINQFPLNNCPTPFVSKSRDPTISKEKDPF